MEMLRFARSVTLAAAIALGSCTGEREIDVSSTVQITPSELVNNIGKYEGKAVEFSVNKRQISLPISGLVSRKRGNDFVIEFNLDGDPDAELVSRTPYSDFDIHHLYNMVGRYGGDFRIVGVVRRGNLEVGYLGGDNDSVNIPLHKVKTKG